MSEQLRFFVPGEPQTKGSMRAFLTKQGKVVMTNANPKTKPWQTQISKVARAALPCWGATRNEGDKFEVYMAFYLPVPKRKNQPWDLDKGIRCVLDALTGIVYEDDTQVIRIVATKRYAKCSEPGVTVEMSIV
jgi:Holliday junction resolvase RusA-like endonuclease